MVFLIKLVVSQIIIAKQKKRKNIVVVSSKQVILLLNVLWASGIIYGYFFGFVRGYCLVFLKGFYQDNFWLLNSVIYKKQYLSLTKLKNLQKQQPSIFCLLHTVKGVLPNNICILFGCGGLLLLIGSGV